MTTDNPYRAQPKKAFWRAAVAQRHFSEFRELSHALTLRADDRIATAGSCFAQHIGRALRERGANYLDLEPAPAYLTQEEAVAHGFGVYSCRYGNLYTVRQLLQLTREAMGDFVPTEIVWQKDARFYDAMRPSVDPFGQRDPDTVVALRQRHLLKVRQMFEELDVFIFTLGLTEGWISKDGTTIFASCPGTVAGKYDQDCYEFKNFSHSEIMTDFSAFHSLLKAMNPGARILLTVSPVSLAATATDEHVLVANTYSKATLRSVAGELADTLPDIEYFPSFEIITTHANHGSFYEPDKRTVNPFGVQHVMEHFFRSLPFSPGTSPVQADSQNAIICDEEKLAEFEEN